MNLRLPALHQATYTRRTGKSVDDLRGHWDGAQWTSLPRLIELAGPPPVLYHTSPACDDIIIDGNLKLASRQAFGHGVYFTGFEASIFPWNAITAQTLAQSGNHKCVFAFRTDKLIEKGYMVGIGSCCERVLFIELVLLETCSHSFDASMFHRSS